MSNIKCARRRRCNGEKNRAGEGKVDEDDLRVILIRMVTECSGEVDI